MDMLSILIVIFGLYNIATSLVLRQAPGLWNALYFKVLPFFGGFICTWPLIAYLLNGAN